MKYPQGLSRPSLWPVILTLVCVATTGDLRAVTPPAKIAYLEGSVVVIPKGTNTPVPAEMGMSIFCGDAVHTNSGKCVVNMTASGLLRMSPNTTVLFPVESNDGNKISVLKMLQGKTWQNFNNLWKDEVFEVRTPSLVAGISDGDHTGFRDRPLRGNEIERLRAEGNAKLDAIRAELKELEGKPVTCPCARCGGKGPHRWTQDAWECNCGATAVTFGNYPTTHGRYNAVRDDYRQRIEEAQRRSR